MTHTEWEILEPLLPPKTETMRGRPVENPRRAIIDGIRKRHVLVDTLGFLLGLNVTPADVQDRDGARLLLWSVLSVAFGWIKLIWADGGYSGQWVDEVASLPRHRNVKLEIVKRSDTTKGFKVLPKRWIVERTFGWLIQSRRLVRDYEVKISHSESMIFFQ